MSELFKSKAGWLAAGIHLLTVLTGLMYVTLIDHTNVIVTLILMILTAPWGFLLMILAAQLGLGPGELEPHKLNALFVVEFAIGGLINAFILYLLGFLLTKAFNYLYPKEISETST